MNKHPKKDEMLEAIRDLLKDGHEKKDIKEITNNLLDIEKNIAIISKENEVQDLELEELKVKSNNPLAN